MATLSPNASVEVGALLYPHMLRFKAVHPGLNKSKRITDWSSHRRALKAIPTGGRDLLQILVPPCSCFVGHLYPPVDSICPAQGIVFPSVGCQVMVLIEHPCDIASVPPVQFQPCGLAPAIQPFPVPRSKFSLIVPSSSWRFSLHLNREFVQFCPGLG